MEHAVLVGEFRSVRPTLAICPLGRIEGFSFFDQIGAIVNDTLAVIAFVVFCVFVIANWMNKPRKK